jgi:6-phosphofructokinase
VRQSARQHSAKIGKVYAGRDGIIGTLSEDLIDTSLEPESAVAALKYTPGGAFGSCRYRLGSLHEHRAQYERLVEVFRAHDIGFFFYNGGGDSQDTAYKISELGAGLSDPIVCVGIPTTIDNDLPITDCCPGFGSVAKYVATSLREAAFDVAAMSRTSTRVFIMEVMGRHAGWITAACALAAEHEGEAPHILLLPEVALNKERFLAKVDESLARYDECVIAVSEGVRGPDGEFISASGSTDAFGHEQLGGAEIIALYAWEDKLVDVTDVIETQKEEYTDTALLTAHCCTTTRRHSSLGKAEAHRPPVAWESAPGVPFTGPELCAQLKDPNRNGHRELSDILEHLKHEPRVKLGVQSRYAPRWRAADHPAVQPSAADQRIHAMDCRRRAVPE